MSQPPPPPYSQPQYAQPQPYAPYGTTPYGAPLGPRTNTLAILAIALALPVSLAGIICGHIALSQIKRTGEAGHGLALAGLVIGYVISAFYVLYFAFIAIVIIAGITSSTTGPTVF